MAVLESECRRMNEEADQTVPDVILDWLEADEDERDMIRTATQIRKSNASLQAQATWISWRQANALKALEAAELHDEELSEVRNIYSMYDKQSYSRNVAMIAGFQTGVPQHTSSRRTGWP